MVVAVQLLLHPKDLNPRQGITTHLTRLTNLYNQIRIPKTSIPARGLLQINAHIPKTSIPLIPKTSIPARGLLQRTLVSFLSPSALNPKDLNPRQGITTDSDVPPSIIITV